MQAYTHFVPLDLGVALLTPPPRAGCANQDGEYYLDVGNYAKT